MDNFYIEGEQATKLKETITRLEQAVKNKIQKWKDEMKQEIQQRIENEMSSFDDKMDEQIKPFQTEIQVIQEKTRKMYELKEVSREK